MSSPQPPPNSQAQQVTYAGDREAQLRQEWEQGRASNPGFFGQFASIADFLRYKAQAAQYREDQNRELRQQVETYRAPMNSAGSYYLGYSHPQLKAMVNDNMDPGTANQQGAAYNRIGNTLANLQADLQNATKVAGSSWEGNAAAKAQGYFTNVATWSGNAAQAAQLTGNQLAQQEQAASLAKNSMTEPVDYDTRDAMKDFFTSSPFQIADTIDKIQGKFEEKQKAHEEAAQVMSTMSGNFQQSSATMPAFAPPPTPADSGGGDPPTPPPPPVVPPGPNQPYTPPGTGTPPGGYTQPAGLGTGTGTTNLSQVGTGGPYNPNLPGGPGGQNNNPVLPGTPPDVFPPNGPGRPGVPGRPTGPGVPGRPTGPGGTGRTTGPGGGNPGGGGLGGRGGGMPGGPGAGGPGAGGPGAGGLGGAAAAKGFGPGGSAGVMGNQQGGFGPQGSGAAGASGVAGRGGAAGMGGGGMGAGAGRGQDDADKEHKSADYLISEENTNDIVGDMPMVAPPVIGG